MKRKSSFVEKDFERWFIRDPHLPEAGTNGKLLFVGWHRNIRRDPDIVCLDEDGGLVIIEVKSKPVDHWAFGQILEYYAGFEGITLEELKSEFGHGKTSKSIEELFTERFDGKSIRDVARKRTLLIVGPRIKTTIHRYLTQILSECLGTRDVTFILGEIGKKRDGSFEVKKYRTDDAILARHAKGFCKSGGRALFVIQEGFKPIFWRIGTVDSRSGLSILAENKVRYDSIKKGERAVRPMTGKLLSNIDVTDSGKLFGDVSSPSKKGRLLGIAGNQAVLALLIDGAPKGCERIIRTDFERNWTSLSDEAPSWDQLIIRKHPSRK